MENDILHLRIEKIIPETADTKSYILAPLNKRDIVFLPGQFLTIIFRFEHETVRRSYSIVSLPGEPLKITVKRVENGAVSRFVLINWKVGDTVESLAPAGRFHLAPQTSFPRDLFFFAAGSGIAPIIPQVRYLLQAEKQSNLYLFYSSRSEADTIFFNEVQQLAKTHPRLRVRYFFSDPQQHWEKRIRLNNGLLEEIMTGLIQHRPADAVFMICGPFTYMRMIKLTLGFMKFHSKQIRTEQYLPAILRSQAPKIFHFPDTTIRLTIKGKTYVLPVKSNETILRAALRNGIALPYSCEGGICSTCAAKCTHGKVEMSINEVLSDAELSQGWILTCTGYPADHQTIITFE
ncbi:iron-sulfur cluster-binding domain-containing protein [Pedobacter sp. BS3]|uniref:flavin reductase family protein n=1 Tax=Pedobacter sp. BS3 TaxID=2567937 RepID=UPI0011EEC27C|nr:iron-sulfur cluster-binding domain-containing protein [Pedobacter sp. BS3]TZF84872.1 iron-sulfur cluster-binding domain-containing protein [Pedobacter sp. BS3]